MNFQNLLSLLLVSAFGAILSQADETCDEDLFNPCTNSTLTFNITTCEEPFAEIARLDSWCTKEWDGFCIATWIECYGGFCENQDEINEIYESSENRPINLDEIRKDCPPSPTFAPVVATVSPPPTPPPTGLPTSRPTSRPTAPPVVPALPNTPAPTNQPTSHPTTSKGKGKGKGGKGTKGTKSKGKDGTKGGTKDGTKGGKGKSKGYPFIHGLSKGNVVNNVMGKGGTWAPGMGKGAGKGATKGGSKGYKAKDGSKGGVKGGSKGGTKGGSKSGSKSGTKGGKAYYYGKGNGKGMSTMFSKTSLEDSQWADQSKTQVMNLATDNALLEASAVVSAATSQGLGLALSLVTVVGVTILSLF